METTQTISQIKNNAILSLETSITSATNLLEMEVAAGLINQEQYKLRMDVIYNERRKLLILKGEIPPITKKKKFRNGIYL